LERGNFPPPFIKEGGGGFFVPKFPLFPKEGAGEILIPLSPPLRKGERWREFGKGGIFSLLFIKEGGGGFFVPKFPLFPKEGAGGDFNPPVSPFMKGGNWRGRFYERGKMEGDLRKGKQ